MGFQCGRLQLLWKNERAPDEDEKILKLYIVPVVEKKLGLQVDSTSDYQVFLRPLLASIQLLGVHECAVFFIGLAIQKISIAHSTPSGDKQQTFFDLAKSFLDSIPLTLLSDREELYNQLKLQVFPNNTAPLDFLSQLYPWGLGH